MFVLPKNYFYTRLLLVFGLIQAVVAFTLLHHADTALGNLGERTLPSLDLAADMKRVPDLMYGASLRAAVLPDSPERESAVAEAAAAAAEFGTLAERYRRMAMVPEDLRLLGAAERLCRVFSAGCATLNATPRPDAEALVRFHNEFRRFDESTQALFDFKVNRAAMWVEQSGTNAHRLVGFMAVNTGILALVLLILLLRLASAKIVPATPDNF